MTKWLLIFDGDCEFCLRHVQRVRRWDARRRIEFLPLQEADLERLGLSREAVEGAMHLVAPDGTSTRGAEAAREILALVRRGRLLAWSLQLPGAMFAAEHVYRWIARRRHRLGCGSDVCRRATAN